MCVCNAIRIGEKEKEEEGEVRERELIKSVFGWGWESRRRGVRELRDEEEAVLNGTVYTACIPRGIVWNARPASVSKLNTPGALRR